MAPRGAAVNVINDNKEMLKNVCFFNISSSYWGFWTKLWMSVIIFCNEWIYINQHKYMKAAGTSNKKKMASEFLGWNENMSLSIIIHTYRLMHSAQKAFLTK